MCNRSEALAILQEVNDFAKIEFGDLVSDCYLYGSYARGDYHTESDVDIAIILNMSLNDISLHHRIFGKLNSDLSLKHNVTVSIAALSQDIFSKYCDVQPYYTNILKEGVRYEG